MAQITNRIESSVITNLQSTKFDVASEAVAVAGKESLSTIAAQSKLLSAGGCASALGGLGASALGSLSGLGLDALGLSGVNEKLGIFKGSLAAAKSLLPSSATLAGLKNAIPRGLPPKSICGISLKNPMASMSTILSAQGLDTKSLISKAGLLESKLLDSVLTNDTKKLLNNAIGTANGLSSVSISKIKDSISKQLSLSGGSLKDKLNLVKLISSGVDINKISALSKTKKPVTIATNTAIINHLTTIDPSLAASYIQQALNDTSSTNTVMTKEIIMTSMASSLTANNDTHVESKLLLLSSLATTIKTGSAKESATLSVATKGVTDKVLANLSTADTSNSTSPVSDYNNIITSLNTLDASWNKDSLGEINYSVVMRNKRLVTLSNKLIATNNVAPVLNGNADTTLPDYLQIAILSSIAGNTEAPVSRCSKIAI
jgi:hypothetical protein